jgi:P-type E1-E2 ATPase
VAQVAGIQDWSAEMKPSEKATRVQDETSRGRRVLFAGDGVNDGPALAAAEVGVAMGTGAASSILVADGVVGAPSLAPLVGGIRAARAARRVVALNQFRSIVYNVGAVSLAAAGLVNPLLAAVLMPLSSGLVIASAAGVERRVRRMETRQSAAGGPGAPGAGVPRSPASPAQGPAPRQGEAA